MPTKLTGQTIGRYRIIEQVGRGGMADVYKAYQPSLDRHVAMKVIHAHLADDPDFLNRFEREAKVVATLRHPNIVQVYDFDAESDLYYMVMEFIDGGTLKTLLDTLQARGTRINLDDAIRIILSVGSALKYAHARGMVHRDVKPGNVMITGDGHVILTDFGIAKIVNTTKLTASGAMTGTPAYMSPEQGRGEPGDERSDIYSLGVMLYQLAVGQLPYEADTPVALVLKHINEDPPLPTSLRPELTRGVERVILKALAKDPGDRYQTVNAMMADLKLAIGLNTDMTPTDTMQRNAAIQLADMGLAVSAGIAPPQVSDASPATVPAQELGRKQALIIGCSEYDDANLTQLVTPGSDVSEFARVLEDSAIGNFDEVITLIDQPVATVQRAISKFYASKNREDVLLLYFSGHGVRDDRGQLYLAARDTEHNLLRGTAISAAFIAEEMDRSYSRRQVVILDCCHSGAFARGSKGAPGLSVGTAAAFEGTGYARVVLTATDSTQYAWEDDRLIGEAEKSIFTHYLVEGLQTGAADVNADGWVTLDELFDYVHAQVVTHSPKQTPAKWSYKQQETFIIARNPHVISKPAELPAELQTALKSNSIWLREGAVTELDRLLNGDDPELACVAYGALTMLSGDDSRRVSEAASKRLDAYIEAWRRRSRVTSEVAQAVLQPAVNTAAIEAPVSATPAMPPRGKRVPRAALIGVPVVALLVILAVVFAASRSSQPPAATGTSQQLPPTARMVKIEAATYRVGRDSSSSNYASVFEGTVNQKCADGAAMRRRYVETYPNQRYALELKDGKYRITAWQLGRSITGEIKTICP